MQDFKQVLGGAGQVYVGEAKLVISIDLGTTFSGASYAILCPGQRPVIEDVKAFPGQSTAGSKVPSIILYNSKCEARLFGAEALTGSLAEEILDEGGQMARWWKVHLKPDHLKISLGIPETAPCNKEEEVDHYQDLPFGLSAEKICSDFLRYMVTCVGSYIRSRVSNGADLLSQLASSIQYILTVPNGYVTALKSFAALRWRFYHPQSDAVFMCFAFPYPYDFHTVGRSSNRRPFELHAYRMAWFLLTEHMRSILSGKPSFASAFAVTIKRDAHLLVTFHFTSTAPLPARLRPLSIFVREAKTVVIAGSVSLGKI